MVCRRDTYCSRRFLLVVVLGPGILIIRRRWWWCSSSSRSTRSSSSRRRGRTSAATAAELGVSPLYLLLLQHGCLGMDRGGMPKNGGWMRECNCFFRKKRSIMSWWMWIRSFWGGVPMGLRIMAGRTSSTRRGGKFGSPHSMTSLHSFKCRSLIKWYTKQD